MEGKFSDFSQLKSLRKSMEKGESPAAAGTAQPRRQRTIVHRTIHEEHARNEGYSKGMKVRMMDTNDEATITGFREGCFELTYPDGLTFTATKGEFIVINKEEDQALYRSMPSSIRKHKEQNELRKSATSGEKIVDLHLERIPGSESIPEWAALDYQMDFFRRTIRENLKHKGRKLIFIHGFGDGRLRDAVRRELDETFALSCTYQYGTADNYGPGTVIVTIR